MLKKIFSEKLAAKGIISIIFIMLILHVFFIIKIIPFVIVWGGRLKDHSQMLRFEMYSMLVNMLLLAMTAVRSGILKLKINKTLLITALWIMFGLFLINTVGNFFSENEFENMCLPL